MFDPEEKDIVVIGEEKLFVTAVEYDDAPTITLENGNRYKVFEDIEEAGERAQEYWEDFAVNDSGEFIFYIGEDQIIDWAFNGGLDDWLDEWKYKPKEHFSPGHTEIRAEYIGIDYKGEVILYFQEGVV
jgi:uncharacterized protein YlzI (FlbEa/FlbD family)